MAQVSSPNLERQNTFSLFTKHHPMKHKQNRGKETIWHKCLVQTWKGRTRSPCSRKLDSYRHKQRQNGSKLTDTRKEEKTDKQVSFAKMMNVGYH